MSSFLRVSFLRASVQVSKHIDLKGAGDVLAQSPLARGFAKCMYSRLNEQTLRPGRFDEQRDECLKAKVSLHRVMMVMVVVVVMMVVILPYV